MEKRGYLFLDKKAQVWVETVVYTLIGLAIIGMVIGISLPKINEFKDKATIEESITVLNELNKQVNVVLSATGQARKTGFKIKKGEITIDSENNKIIYALKESNHKYSEIGVLFNQGDIQILTEENNKVYDVYLILDLSNLDLQYEGKDEVKVLSQSPTIYQILIKNQGNKVLDFSLI